MHRCFEENQNVSVTRTAIIVLQYLYIRPVMGYADVIWSSCDKEALYRFLKLQMPTAGIVLYTDHLAPSVTLFTKLE